MGFLDELQEQTQGKIVNPDTVVSQVENMLSFLTGEPAPAAATAATATADQATSPTNLGATPSGNVQPFEGNFGHSGEFGEQRGDHVHAGIDFATPMGTRILSMAGGTVTQANTDAQGGGYGNFVLVDHGGGFVTRYAHLSQVNVAPGDKVSAGQAIGAAGSTGQSTGPHLHFEVIQNGKPIDPTPLLAGGASIVGSAPAASAGTSGSAQPTPLSPEELLAAQIDRATAFLSGEEVPEDPSTESTQTATGQTGEGGDSESWIRQAMAITGVDPSWYEGLKARMAQESGGQNIPQAIHDVNTEKGTPAFGPMQVIEPTFNAYKLPGYENWRDPLHSTIAAIRYIQSRYGHPSKLPKGGY